jgi:radial spoke head protein 4/6
MDVAAAKAILSRKEGSASV